jgi:small GTP-binding protein
MAAEKKIYSIVLMGDAASGKTSLSTKYLRDTFSEDYKKTTTVDFEIVKFPKAELQLWDTPGASEDISLRGLTLITADACILVFDLTRKESFDNLTTFLGEIRKATSNLPIMLVGTKLDLHQQRVVSKTDAINFVKEYNLTGYKEVSAAIDVDFQQTFNNIIKKINDTLTPSSTATTPMWASDKKAITPDSTGATCSAPNPCRIS